MFVCIVNASYCDSSSVLFTADNILPKPTITSIMVNDRGKIDVTMASFDGAPYGLFIALFRRTDLSIPVEVNAIHRSTEGIITGPTAIPGATYDMTVWFSSDERFTPTPAKDTLQVEEAGMYVKVMIH